MKLEVTATAFEMSLALTSHYTDRKLRDAGHVKTECRDRLS
jgi:hypothetical protein